MTRTASRIVLALGVALLVAGAAGPVAREVAESAPTPSPARMRLDEIREHLVQARFESALSAIGTLLGDPALEPGERADALVLRAQAHVGLGDLDSAERDYREILKVQPGYEPTPALTPQKAFDRFARVQAEMTGTLELTIDPPQARVTVDGLPVVPDATKGVRALVGDRTLRAELLGHDPDDRVVRVEPNRKTEIAITLTPNARTVILRTEPEDVRVRVDGREVGATKRREGGVPGAAAELVVEHLPLGEHVFELSRPCFATRTLRDVLSVDLLDKSPKRYETVRLEPERSRLIVRAGPAGAEVRLDGEVRGKLPLGALDACPGEHTLEVRAGGRVVWREPLALVGSEETVVEIAPRPNLVVLGDGEALERAVAYLRAHTVLERRPLPPGFAATSATGWAALGLPRECDLALAVVPASRSGEADSWFLYSPILRRIAPLVGPPGPAARPTWTASTWGFATADAAATGSPVVVEVRSGSSAASIGLVPGSRIVSLGEHPVERSEQVGATLAAASVARPLALSWLDLQGAPKGADLIGRAGPRLYVDDADPSAAVERAAWAHVDSIVDPEHASTALANLGLLFLDAGLPDLAEQAWRRVAWEDRPGIGKGTRAYYLGVALEALGREEAAVAHYREAASTDARTFDDAGPRVAAAARDRLADLGVAVNAR